MKKLSKKSILKKKILLNKLFLALCVSTSFLAQAGPKGALMGVGKYMGNIGNSVLQGGKAALQNAKDIFDVFNGRTVSDSISTGIDLTNPSGGETTKKTGNVNNNHTEDKTNYHSDNTSSEARTNDTHAVNEISNNINQQNSQQVGIGNVQITQVSNVNSDDDMPSGSLNNIKVNSSYQGNRKNKKGNNSSAGSASDSASDSDIDTSDHSSADEINIHTSPATNLILAGVHDNSTSSSTFSGTAKDSDGNQNKDTHESQQQVLILPTEENDIVNNGGNNNIEQPSITSVVTNNAIANSLVNTPISPNVMLDDEEVNMLGTLFDENAQNVMDELIEDRVLSDQNIVVSIAGSNNDEAQEVLSDDNSNNRNMQNMNQQEFINEQSNSLSDNQRQNIIDRRALGSRSNNRSNNVAGAIRQANIDYNAVRNSQKNISKGVYNQTKHELESDPSILSRLDSSNAQDSQFLIDKIRDIKYNAAESYNSNNIGAHSSSLSNETYFSIEIKRLLQQRNDWGFLSMYGIDLMNKAAVIAEKLAQLDVADANIDINSNIAQADQEKLNKRAVALGKTAKTPDSFKIKEEKIIYVFNILNMAKEQASFERLYELLDEVKKLNPVKDEVSGYNDNGEYRAVMIVDNNAGQKANNTIDKNALSNLYQEILDVIKYAFIGNKYAYPVFLEIVKKGKKLGESKLKGNTTSNTDLDTINNINDNSILIQ